MKRMKHPTHGFHHAYGTREEEAMRKNGWVEDITAEVVSDEPEPESTSDRVALLATASELGVKVDGRWSTTRLAEELAKA